MAAGAKFLFLSPSIISHRMTASLHVGSAVGRKATPASLPEMPKKPASAFLLFLSKETPRLKASNPSIAHVEIMRLAGKNWMELSEEQKKPLQEEARRSLDEWKEKADAFKQKLSKSHLLEKYEKKKTEEKMDRKLHKAQRERKKLVEDLGRPTKPPSAYCLFLKDHFPVAKNKLGSSSSVVEVSKVVAEDYKMLSEDKRAEYTRRSHELAERFKVELAAWEKKMAKDGRLAKLEEIGEDIKTIRSKKREINDEFSR
jgi:hypothetical protein